jgi:hypothetical protein
MMRFLLASLLCFVSICAQAAQPLPEAVQRDLPGLALHGESSYRFIGLKVYDIRLWGPGGKYVPGQSFALELEYNMNFKGADIAKRSVDEMRGQGYGPEDKLERWRVEMAKVFPDIKPGDTLIGVAQPGKEARFYTREKFIATVPDLEFSQAFFDIWLSDKSSEPGLKKRLTEKK